MFYVKQHKMMIIRVTYLPFGPGADITKNLKIKLVPRDPTMFQNCYEGRSHEKRRNQLWLQSFFL